MPLSHRRDPVKDPNWSEDGSALYPFKEGIHTNSSQVDVRDPDLSGMSMNCTVSSSLSAPTTPYARCYPALTLDCCCSLPSVCHRTVFRVCVGAWRNSIHSTQVVALCAVCGVFLLVFFLVGVVKNASMQAWSNVQYYLICEALGAVSSLSAQSTLTAPGSTTCSSPHHEPRRRWRRRIRTRAPRWWWLSRWHCVVFNRLWSGQVKRGFIYAGICGAGKDQLGQPARQLDGLHWCQSLAQCLLCLVTPSRA